LLEAHPEIEICAEASSAKAAESHIAALHPDLIFLDVDMPGRTGFDLLQNLAQLPAVIFTTAHDQFAVRAFDVGAVDYLLKPIDPARLAQALARLSEDPISPDPSVEAPFAADDHVFIKDGERCWFVRVGEIRLLEAEGNYVRVYFGRERPLIGRTLQTLEARLDPKCFVRVSRQHLVNLRFIRAIEPWIDGGLLLRLVEGDPPIKASRRRALVLREQLSF
jgi:two-component system LytT family response regulator